MICCSCVWGKNIRSLSSDLTQFFLFLKKFALQTNKIKIWSAINQSYHIIYAFDLRWTLQKYLRTFLHKNEVMMIGLTNQSYFSMCHFMVRLFICKVFFILTHIINLKIFQIGLFFRLASDWFQMAFILFEEFQIVSSDFRLLQIGRNWQFTSVNKAALRTTDAGKSVYIYVYIYMYIYIWTFHMPQLSPPRTCPKRPLEFSLRLCQIDSSKFRLASDCFQIYFRL